MDSNYKSYLFEDDNKFGNNFHILYLEHNFNLLKTLVTKKLKNSENLLNDQLHLLSSPLINAFN